MKAKQGVKVTTIKDVAREAGVSVATVSRALNGLGGMSEETREYVLGVCERMAYVPNSLARGLVMQHTQTIGIVIPDITSPFYAKLMELAAGEAKLLGYQVLFCNSFRNYEMEEDYFKLLIGNQVEGILFFPVGEQSAKNLYHFMRYVPIVALNQMPEGNPIPYVCTDEAKSGEIAARYLIECGFRDMLFIGYDARRMAHRKRVESFQGVTKQAGVAGRIFETERQYKSSFERGYRQFGEFLEQKTKLPEAVIAASDATANGVIKACVERNISIPEELSLIGFDNINADLPTISLTTVSISHSLHVKRAIEMLIRMQSGISLKREEGHVFLKPELIERDSCKIHTS
ncbi:MAG: LacI family DNA-binding transcriptional regulator [Lachnospiraceae bacterium]|nr:LacI family DNA-binding transcriptional regulator [Lachnospiraceae bacterium]